MTKIGFFLVRTVTESLQTGNTSAGQNANNPTHQWQGRSEVEVHKAGQRSKYTRQVRGRSTQGRSEVGVQKSGQRAEYTMFSGNDTACMLYGALISQYTLWLVQTFSTDSFLVLTSVECLLTCSVPTVWRSASRVCFEWCSSIQYTHFLVALGSLLDLV